MKPEKVGTVWTSRAALVDAQGQVLGHCIDTPNGIAKALMENPRAAAVRSFCDGKHQRDHYADRMKSWNTCPSHFTPATA